MILGLRWSNSPTSIAKEINIKRTEVNLFFIVKIIF